VLVGAVAFAIGLAIFAWILVSAGYFGISAKGKQGPETTFAPQR
jgi:hypothetical protein